MTRGPTEIGLSKINKSRRGTRWLTFQHSRLLFIHSVYSFQHKQRPVLRLRRCQSFLWLRKLNTFWTKIEPSIQSRKERAKEPNKPISYFLKIWNWYITRMSKHSHIWSWTSFLFDSCLSGYDMLITDPSYIFIKTRSHLSHSLWIGF